MPNNMDDSSRMSLVDLRQYVEQVMGKEDWLTLYETTEGVDERKGRFCCLVSPDHLNESLSNQSWDISIGTMGPSFVSEGVSGSTRYVRLGDEAVEPFVYKRYFSGMRDPYFEVSEEFRHFHDLYEEKKTGNLLAFDDAGDEIPVVRITENRVQARLGFVKEYLTARDMCLLLFFEFDRYSAKTMNELGLETGTQIHNAEGITYRYFADAWPSSDERRTTFARMCGKKVVRGTPKPLRETPWTVERKFQKLVIGLDEDGNEVEYTCAEDELANYFGKNPHAPHFLTPVFFRREVLAKYYGDARRYVVDDSQVTCGGLWSVRLDNNHPQYVIVFLGDLGHMPHKEQLYWRSFNIPPDGKMSDTYFGRSILGMWIGPEAPDLLFKVRYAAFCKAWAEKYGWDLFKPLKATDAHYLNTLHIPSDGNLADLDNQIIALAKVLVERINEEEIVKHAQVDSGDKGIAKLEKYLAVQGFHPAGTRLVFLRQLQALRSGPAHVKGKDYMKAAAHFNLDDKGYQAAFTDILKSAIALLKDLSDFFLPNQAAGDSDEDLSKPV